MSWLSACSKVGPAGSRPAEEKENLQRICAAPFLHVLSLRNHARACFELLSPRLPWIRPQIPLFQKGQGDFKIPSWAEGELDPLTGTYWLHAQAQ